MDINNNVTKLNTFLAEKTSFYAEANARTYYYNYGQQQPQEFPSEIFLKLYEKDYKFTKKQLDNIFQQITYSKSKSFLAKPEKSNGYGYNANSTNVFKTKFLKKFFEVYVPTSRQMDIIIQCYESMSQRYNIHVIMKDELFWIQLLLDKDYKFSDIQKEKLVALGYTALAFCDNNCTIEEIENMLLCIKESEFEGFKKLVESGNHVITKECFLKLLQNKNSDDFSDFFNYFLEKNLEITKELLQKLLLKEHSYNCKFDRSKCHSKYIAACNDEYDLDDLKEYCSNNNFTSQIFKELVDKFKPELNADLLVNILKTSASTYNNYSYAKNPFDTFDILEYFTERGVEMTVAVLEVAIKINNKTIVNQLINEYKLIPNKTCLDYAAKLFHQNRFDKTETLLEKFLNYRIIPDNKTLMNLLEYGYYYIKDSGAVEMLIQYGLAVDIETLEICFKHKFSIDNLERFNVKLNEEIYYICYKNNFFPENMVFDIDTKVLKLRDMCRDPKSDIVKILEHCETENVKLDRYCFDNACKNNKSLVSVFLHMGCKPTTYSMLWYNSENRNSVNAEKTIELFTPFLNKEDIPDWKFMSTHYDVVMDYAKV